MTLEELREILAQALHGRSASNIDGFELVGPTHVRTYGIIYRLIDPHIGFPMAVKRCINPEHGTPARRSCEAQFKSLKRVAEAMGEGGEYRSPAAVCHIPDQGIFIMGWAPGRPLLDYYLNWRTPLATLIAETRRAGRWLGLFHRRHTLPAAALDAEIHLESVRQARAAARPGAAADRVLISGLEALEQTAREAAGATLAQSWLHGDFHCANLLVERDCVTSIDIELRDDGASLIDVVTFLNHLDHLLTLPKGLRNLPRRRPIAAAFLDGYGDGTDFTSTKHLAWLYLQRSLKFYFDFCDAGSVFHNRYFRFFHRPRIARLTGDLEQSFGCSAAGGSAA